MQTVTLNNGVKMPILGFGVYQIPAEETEHAVDRRPRGRLPPPRHRRRLRQRGSRRRAPSPPAASPATTCSSPPSCGSRTRPAEENTRRAFETSLQRLGLDHLDLYLIHQPLGDVLRPVARHGGAAQRGPGPGDRRLQLPPRPARRPDRPQRDRPGRQPDRDPPLPPARRRPGPHARTRGPDRVLGAVRRGPQRPVHRPRPQRHRPRRTASPSPRSSCAGSSSATSSSSPSPSAPSGWPRTSTSSTSPSPTSR